MLKKLALKIGFTPTESKVILFLILVFIVGAGVKFFRSKPETKKSNFDYSKEDSLFAAAVNEAVLLPETDELKENIDYKSEVLDFNTRNFDPNKEKIEPAEKSININSAELEDLINLPGIGEKTAENILNLRKEKGGFQELDELLQVKGIGNSKLTKIKKYLYIQ